MSVSSINLTNHLSNSCIQEIHAKNDNAASKQTVFPRPDGHISVIKNRPDMPVRK